MAEKVMMNGIATTARDPSAYVQWAVQQETRKEQEANRADWDEEEGEWPRERTRVTGGTKTCRTGSGKKETMRRSMAMETVGTDGEPLA